MLLWLWLAAVAWIQPRAWELPYAAPVALKEKEKTYHTPGTNHIPQVWPPKKKKKKKKKKARERGNPGKILSQKGTFEGSYNNVLYLCSTFLQSSFTNAIESSEKLI